MIRAVYIALVFALFPPVVSAQLSERAASANSDLDAARLTRIDQAIENAIDAREIPGAVAMVLHDGNVAYHKSFGFADVAAREPMRNDSIFRIASMTKAITTVGVMLLYEQGHFLLSDPVADYIPEFANMRIVGEVGADGTILTSQEAHNPIRIIDLLTHTSGIAYPFLASATNRAYVHAGVIDGITSTSLSLRTNIERIASQPLLFEPGSEFAYGLSTDVLGRLIEVISGKTLAGFFQQEIFLPLNMKDTYFYLPAEKADRLVTMYSDTSGTGIAVSKGDEEAIIAVNPSYPIEGAKAHFSGGAGLSSTAGDYARFLQMLLDEGAIDGRSFLSRKSVELMRASRVDMDGDGDPDFGMGFRVFDDPDELNELGSLGTYSWGGAFYTSYWIDPQEQLIGVLMSQVRPAHSDIDKLFNMLVYQALR